MAAALAGQEAGDGAVVVVGAPETVLDGAVTAGPGRDEAPVATREHVQPVGPSRVWTPSV